MINHKCENCGGTLKLNRMSGLYKCTSCGSEFSLENESVSPEKIFIDAGEEFLKLKEFDKALESFDSACKLSPKNSASWLGMAKAMTKNFSELNGKIYKDVCKFMQNADENLSDDERKLVSNDLKKYQSLKNDFEQNERARYVSETFANGLKYFTLAVFAVMAIVNLIITIYSSSGFFWKLVGLIIVMIIEVVVYKIVSIVLKLIKPKKKWQYWLAVILVVLSMLILFALDVALAKAI